MRENWKEFTETSQAFLAKAQSSMKASEARAFYELAEKSSQHALAIWIELESNSVLLFLQAYKSQSHAAYSDFCARNGLAMLAKVDFEAVLDSLAES